MVNGDGGTAPGDGGTSPHLSDATGPGGDPAPAVPRYSELAEPARVPSATRIARAVHAGDRAGLHALCDPLADTPYLDVVLRRGLEDPSARRALSALWDEDRDDALVGTLHGGELVDAAWDARTAQRAAEVTDEQWRAFHAALATAEDVLQEVTARRPDARTAWARRIAAAMGQGQQTSEGRRRFARAGGVEAAPFSARLSLFSLLLPKWQGSWHQVEEFVDQMCTGPDPDAWVLSGHLFAERWLDAATDAEFTDYLGSAEGAARRAAYARDVEERLPDTTWHRARTALGTLAFLHSWTGRPDLAAASFALLGDEPVGAPYAYAVPDVYARHRRLALGGAR